MPSTRSALAVAALATIGCTRIPPGHSAVDHIDVRGNRAVDGDDIKAKIATTETPKFMGLFRGLVFEYELYDPYVLGYDLARVERYYRARGYYEAKARAGRVLPRGDDHVRVEIVVDEGRPMRVREVQYAIDGALDAKDRAAMESAARAHLPIGALLDEDEIGRVQKAIQTALENRGYAKATVDVRARADIVRHEAAVVVDVTPLERCTIGRVRIENLGELSERAVRRQLDLHEGDPFSRVGLERAERRLMDLGVVSSLTIEVDRAGAPVGAAPLVVRLQPTKLRELRIGGGFELDALKADVHARARWQDRNFLGGLRRFEVDFAPGVVLYPTRITDFRAPERLLFEVRSRAELRQPGFIEALTTGFVRVEPNMFPLLLRSRVIPDEPLFGYRELRTSEGVQRSFGPLTLTLSHALQIENPFAYAGPVDRSLQTLLISYLEVLGALDLRDDPVHTRKGAYFSGEVQLAGLGGQPRDVRVQPEARAYVPLGKHVTLAARATVGFLFPMNYDVGTDARSVQTVFFRGFFSGGPNQNRGYPLRGIGPQGGVGFLNPIVGACTPQQEGDPCAVPLGGLSLWEASLESRFALGGPFLAVLFCDASDVAAERLTLRFDRPHLSCGAGARYDTPVGPLRLDVAYRIPGAQVFSGTAEPVPDLFAGVPVAIQVGLGEAF